MKNTSIRLDESTIANIVALAEKEKRNFNQMTRILLDEAVAGRIDIGQEFLKQVDGK